MRPYHPSQQLIYRSGSLLGQHLEYNIRHRGGVQASGRGQNWICPEDVGTRSLRSGGVMAMHITGVLDRTFMAIGRWRLLGFMVYIQQQISSFNTGVSVRMSTQPWFLHFKVGLHIMIPPHTPFTLSPISPRSASPITSPSHVSTKTPYDGPSGMPFHNFQPKFLPDTSAGVQPKISNQTYIHISHLGSIWDFPTENNFYTAQLGSIPKFPSNHPWVAPSSYTFTEREKFHHAPPAPRFYHFTPIEDPSTQPTSSPYYFPTQAPCTCPTQIPFHTWAIPGRLHIPTFHTVLVFQSVSHFQVQSRMPVPDTVVNPVVYRC